MARHQPSDQNQLALPGLEEQEVDLTHPTDPRPDLTEPARADEPEPQARSPFALGKVSPASSETHLAPGKKGPPFPGPWAVKAVVQDRKRRDPLA